MQSHHNTVSYIIVVYLTVVYLDSTRWNRITTSYYNNNVKFARTRSNTNVRAVFLQGQHDTVSYITVVY